MFVVSPEVVIILFSIMDLLNFMDRGIVPGSTVEFNHFIRDTTHSSSPDLLLGLLQSSFIVGFILGSILFGNMVHHYSSFYLVRIGMMIWLLAVSLSFASYFANSYEFLIIARMISGFGEASLQTTVPPWIQRHAKPKQQGLWLSVFYTTLPLGTALGYAYSSMMSESAGWGWSFFGEAIAMVPILVYFCSLDEEAIIASTHPTPTTNLSNTTTSPPAAALPIETFPSSEETDINDTPAQSQKQLLLPATPKPTVWTELIRICQEPIYVALILGYAAQVGGIMALATFGSPILIGLGYFDSESEASTTFGIIVSLAGILGTPIGGYFQDKLSEPFVAAAAAAATTTTSATTTTNPTTDDDDGDDDNKEHNPEMDLIPSSLQHLTGKALYEYIGWIIVSMIVMSVVGTFLLCIAYVIYDKAAYLAILALGCMFTFMTITGCSVSFMLTVPVQHRSFAIAFGNIIGHVLGDVPSPVIAGWLKDELAPNCVISSSVDDDSQADNVLTSDACRDEEGQLRLFFFIVALWMVWFTVFFVIAWYLCHLTVLKFDSVCDSPSSSPLDSKHIMEEEKVKKEDDNRDPLLSTRQKDALL